MDKRVMRERMRRKKRQMMIRKYTKLASYAIAAVLVVVFVVRGIIFPIMNRVGGKEPGETVPVQAQTVEADPNAAVRRPLKGSGDIGKISSMTPGWHESEEGRWYQNADGTYYAGGFQEIDGVKYSFDENGYMQTGWVTKGVNDYYFNENGAYDSSQKKPMLALTFDDGPGQYTDALLDCLEENNAHATFFMLGQNVGNFPDTVKRMADLGCEIGSHSWDHLDLTGLSQEGVVKEFKDTDDALIQACGQAATVARAPYGSYNQDVIDIVGKPFFMWSLDSLDWSYKDVDLDYNEIMNGDLSDGSIILMHDIHEPSVQAAQRIIPDLVAKGYKLVTVSEMAEAKNVTLQNASYNCFWQSRLESGEVPGYQGNSDDGLSEEETDGISDGDDGTEYTDGDDSDEYSDSDDGISDGTDDISDGEDA